jgi:hypothetical protein
LIFLHKEKLVLVKGIFLSQILFVVREWQWYLKHKMHKKINFTPFADCDKINVSYAKNLERWQENEHS